MLFRSKGWLEDNFPDVDPARSGERERIQREIDRSFPASRPISLEASGLESLLASADPPPLEQVMEVERRHEGEARITHLVDLVAEEKVEHIDEQRPAIRRMGEERLELLIERIFRDLRDDEYRDRVIAREFGISPATCPEHAAQAGLSHLVVSEAGTESASLCISL